MKDSVNWMDRLPHPYAAAVSYDPADLGNAALHARLSAGPSVELDPEVTHKLYVRHWWTGPVLAKTRPGGEVTPMAAARLLLRDGIVVSLLGWPNANAWLDYVMTLDRAELEAGPLEVTAAIGQRLLTYHPVWSFEKGGPDHG